MTKYIPPSCFGGGFGDALAQPKFEPDLAQDYPISGGSMTQRDFELIARVIRHRGEKATGTDAWSQGFRSAARAIARDFEDELAASNPRFRRDIFQAAARVPQPPARSWS